MSDELVREVRDRLEEAWLWDRENRHDAHEDLKFLAGDQWPQSVRQAREAENRPVITINRLPQFVRQVTNDIRQNPPSIKAVPVDSVTDPALANVYTGLIRQIEYQSSAQHVYATAGEHAVSCGIGHWRIDTDFVEDSVFEQEIRIRRIPNPLSVYYDPGAIEPSRADGNWTVVTELIPIKAFREQYPGAREVDVEITDDNVHEGGLFWRTQEAIRIAEFWRKVPMKRRLMAFQDESAGVSTLDVTDLGPEQLAFLPAPIGEREVDGHKVEQALVSGAEVLDGFNAWAGRWIPIVPVVGAEIPLDTKVIRHGLIRFARDPQQLYNYWRTAAAEAIALAPKSPYLATPDMIGAHKAQWDSANTTARPYLLYKPDRNAPGAMPRRERPADPPQALWNEGALASDDMKATTGIFDAGLGARSNETSGRAILARQREGDTGTFHFADNLVHAVQHSGRILIDLIPRIYDSERIVRIVQDDDAEDFVPINTVVFDDDGEPLILNDLADGRFDVRVSVGPSFTTKRVEAAQSMISFVQAVPNAAALIADLIAKNQDWPGAEEIAARLKRAIPAEIRGEGGEAGEGPPQPDPEAEMVNRLLVRGRESEIAEREAKTAKTEAEAEGRALENLEQRARLGI